MNERNFVTLHRLHGLGDVLCNGSLPASLMCEGIWGLHNVASRRDGRTMVLFLKAKKEIPDKAKAA